MVPNSLNMAPIWGHGVPNSSSGYVEFDFDTFRSLRVIRLAQKPGDAREGKRLHSGWIFRIFANISIFLNRYTSLYV